MATARTPKEIVDTPSPLDGADEHKLEYIKSILEIAQDDIRHIQLLVTAALGISAVYVTQLPLGELRDLPVGVRSVLAVGLVAMAFSSLFYFRYIRCLHRTRMSIARCLPSVDALKARELWAGDYGVWKQHKREYETGRALFTIGAILLSFVIVYLLFDS
jgi:hypothetical protein